MDVASRPKYSILSVESSDDKPDCSICQDIYKDDQQVGILKCGHIFHLNCFLKWEKKVIYEA